MKQKLEKRITKAEAKRHLLEIVLNNYQLKSQILSVSEHDSEYSKSNEDQLDLGE